MKHVFKRFIVAALIAATAAANAQIPTGSAYRGHQILDTDWKTTTELDPRSDTFQNAAFDDSDWKRVSVPHNWDGYEGYRQAKHGVHHGSAWYRKSFTVPSSERGRQVSLFFEGVGSYATVWVNGQYVGEHAGGLTTFSIDITHAISFDAPNQLSVQADHPAHIRDLPWVCGGCELAYGFSEGTQPFGIFRPVHLVTTNPIRISPFGVHIWSNQDVSENGATLHVSTQIEYNSEPNGQVPILLKQQLADHTGHVLAETLSSDLNNPIPLSLAQVRLWHPDHPYLYTVTTQIMQGGKVLDEVRTPYGIRSVSWPDLNGPSDQPLLINGKPFFLNGVADYEHLLGQSHAFSPEQINTRASKIHAAGFNIFRDAHHPHNLRFNQIWDRDGMLWWTQFGAHIWFENEAFQSNYKTLLRDWIKERRNSPSLILYGLQNESKLPAWFAKECADIIREMDPTASIQRPITTCNGGEGTDWDVAQNWSGTYGGDLYNYANEIRQQRLVGEYGAWRSIDLHSEGGFIEDGILSEDRMAALMETKVRLAETVRDKAIGHFAWPMTTHQNPGRNVGGSGQQTTDGIRELDQIGPANNKGLQTIWGEPLDVFYMYRSNYTPANQDPMVYIVSHTWPDRWTEPGLKDGIIVYSNCDEVELFNDLGRKSLGVRKRGPRGTHFTWNQVDIQYNTLYAEARIDGQTVATDIIQFHHLPPAPLASAANAKEDPIQAKTHDRNYLYRINCGGPDYTDTNGNLWLADQSDGESATWGSTSWGDRFANLPSAFGSKRRVYHPINGTRDDLLLQSFRYGRDELSYRFELPNGNYEVELYFIEPWYGIDSSKDVAGWRLFDIALNGETRIQNLDIWSEVGPATALSQRLPVKITDGELTISFPEVRSTQAVLSAIAISTSNKRKISAKTDRLITALKSSHPSTSAKTWLDTGDKLFSDAASTLADLSYPLRESEWIQLDSSAVTRPGFSAAFTLSQDADIFIAIAEPKPAWLSSWEKSEFNLSTANPDHREIPVYRKRFNRGEEVSLGSGTAYIPIVKRRPEPAPATSVSNFTVRGSQVSQQWQAIANLRSGRSLYSDGGPSIERFYSRLSDCDWLRGPQADALNPDLEITFSVDDHTEVYLALDPGIATRPEWLQDWIPTNFYIQPLGSDRISMLKRRYAPGETVRLGPNGILPDGSAAKLYSAVVRSVRESFLKPITKHQPENGIAEWEIYVGVGDRYGLNVPYRYQGETPLEAKLEITSNIDGSLICDDTFTIAPSIGNPVTDVIRLRTCDSINAGNYTIRFSFEPGTNISFQNVTVE
ncbi:malectin domain-containing carbohydrate-binding protein [Pelagicoccus sp. SDUM812005]|uniref:malectin domain-containing carbohydrate-binding protein n=1 Tax=Pelagicoccus sp. SDUM812005 TaxID=3041257 RepID=UPI00280EE58D|nr:malectin domain-containing carbohydrate-binding protein [Pelagicoccus sp. SDUM812005]MDQ8179391.1 malectin domain-containing carbohydrate-binding protein [Pelagicoccus sp. SDUM812005]